MAQHDTRHDGKSNHREAADENKMETGHSLHGPKHREESPEYQKEKSEAKGAPDRHTRRGCAVKRNLHTEKNRHGEESDDPCEPGNEREYLQEKARQHH